MAELKKCPDEFEKLYHSLLTDEELIRRYKEYEWALNGIQSYKDKKILDAGCGGSPLPFFFAVEGAQVFAVDVNFKFGTAEELAFYCLFSLYPQHRLNFFNSNLDDLPFRDNYFDYVVCTSVLHNFNGNFRRRCVNQLVRVLKKHLIITVDFAHCSRTFSVNHKQLKLIKHKKKGTIEMSIFKKKRQ